MGRTLRRWAGVSLAALLSGCYPHWNESFRCPAGMPMPGPLDVSTATTLGPARPVPVSEPIPTPKPREQFRIPNELPGAEAPPIKLPPLPKDEMGRDKVIGALYPTLPPLEPEPTPAPGPDGRPLTLADLQALAAANSPVLRRAAAEVEATRGLAVQAGLYPNPFVGYSGQQIQPGGPTRNAGQQGVVIEQMIKTGGKLQLARAVAGIEALNAEVALRQTQVDVSAQVRMNYFGVLVAQESVRVARALAEVTDEAFRLQVQQVKGGQAAAYEPLQLYVFAAQARNTLVQARNRYQSAWRQLAAVMGLPETPPTQLAGRADAEVPAYTYEAAAEWMLGRHTALRAAENNILKARHAARLAEVNRLPDVQTGTLFMQDNSMGQFQFNVEVGVTLPLWDRNQGNIRAARAQVARAEQDLSATRNDLLQRLAEAFERFQSNRALVTSYREQILGNQVRFYRGLRDRYQQQPAAVTFADLVNAQQTLAGAQAAYLGLLANQWQAVVDVAQLLQVDDLYPPGESECPAAAPAHLPDAAPPATAAAAPSPPQLPAALPPAGQWKAAPEEAP